MLILVFVFLNRIGIPEFLSSIQIMAWKLNWYWIQVHDLNTGEVCNSDLFVYLNSIFDEPVTESIPERNKIIGKYMVWLLNGQMVHRWILLVHRYTITIQLPDFWPRYSGHHSVNRTKSLLYFPYYSAYAFNPQQNPVYRQWIES